ncbi:MAG TPA: PD-(D/E)XK nuclease family protein [Acidimicrobiia bacterium]
MSFAPPRSLSPSSCSSFKECPLAFRFSYLERLPEPPAPWTSKGTLVHRALELLLDRPADERTLDAGLADLAHARVELAPHPDFADLDLTDAEWQQFERDSETLVRRYFQLEDPRTVQPIGLELKLEADLGGVRLRGIIDRLELDEHGELVVTDYKTGSVPSELWEAKSLGGVHVYALLCERMLGRRPARVQLYYLSKPEAIIATPTDQSITGVERRTTALHAAIAQACQRDDFRPRPGRLCNFCTFQPYCPAHGGDPVQAVELRGPGTVVAAPLPLVPAG